MFLVEAKTLFVEALLATFSSAYPDDRFKDLWVSIEYPDKEANYPGIWVDFQATQPVRSMGINHEEYTDPLDPDNKAYPITRYSFAGVMSMTVVAMTSLERDTLTDEVAKIVAFGKEHETYAEFHAQMENNDLINIRMNFDEINIGGSSETPGTPWATDDIIYEATVSVNLEGDFAYLPALGTLVLLSQIVVIPYTIPPGDPTSPGGWM